MAKLYFRYSAMNAGKSTAIIQIAHNYQERDMRALICKPSVDTKAGTKISSRVWLEKEIDVLFDVDDDVSEKMDLSGISCVLVDEAQFLSPDQVDQLWHIAVTGGVPVICYGIRTDFLMKGFPGSTRLLEIAHSIEEIKTICRCGKKALYNMRFVDGKPTFAGDQVAIDGEEVTYESVCGKCFVEKKGWLREKGI